MSSEPATTQPPPLDPTLVASQGSPSAIGPLSLPAVPETGRYDFQRVLGVGGMGEVRLCVDRRVGREVAFKIALTQDGRPPSERFVREALLQARLEHPSFVPVYDVGTDERGELFFTMRRIRGETLHAILQTLAAGGVARFGRGRLLGAFAQLCLAVDYAHSRGVVHRDLKPANVMLGDFGEVYVLDWGIAKVVGESDVLAERAEPRVSSPSATMEGAILGTPGYMAPEQLRGENATIDRRADVYALGAILFEILALEPLHRGTSLMEVYAATIDGRGRNPTERAPQRDVPPELAAICLRATSPDRDARFASARDLANAIEAVLEGDRDATARKRTGELHAARAEEVLRGSDEPDARARAGREAVRALAFDPTNVAAQSTLVEVVTRPLSRVPDEARRSAAATQEEGNVTLSRWYANGLGAVCLSFAAMFLVMGVRDPWTFAAMLATGFGAVGVLVFAARGGRRVAALHTVGFLLICATNVLLARWMTSWIVVPVAMFVNAVSLTFYASPRDRTLRTALAMAVVMLPIALDEAHLVPPSYLVEPDRMIIYARLASFPSWLPWILGAATASMLLIGSFFLTRLLDRLAELELRVHAQAWMLRQVIVSR